MLRFKAVVTTAGFLSGVRSYFRPRRQSEESRVVSQATARPYYRAAETRRRRFAGEHAVAERSGGESQGSMTVAPENGASMAGERGQRCGYAMARWRRTGARFEVAPF
jgi:hypothetical protein